MRGLIFGIAGLLLLASPAFCQVDTLMLVEIGSIEAPSDITNLYVEDLDGDNLKEIILTTATNIHIYNGITYEEIWTSPELVNPRDLLFEDINNDSLIDLSVKDSLNITLFDPLNFATIWTSPAFDSTYSCYTIGDRNDDDWIDVAIITELSGEAGIDTVVIYIYDGPDYAYEDGFPILKEYTYSVKEAFIHKFLDNGHFTIKLIIYLDYYLYHQTDEPPYRIIVIKSGDVLVIDNENFADYDRYEIGRLLSYRIFSGNGDSNVYAITHYFYDSMDWIVTRKKVTEIKSDTVITNTVWYIEHILSDWKGYTLGDIYVGNQSGEMCYGSGDSLYLVTIPDLDLIWVSSGLSDLESVMSTITSSIFSYPKQVVYRRYFEPGYKLVDGSSGELTSVLLMEGLEISRINDVNGDTDDEILSIEGRDLYIYGLYRTDISDRTPNPHRVFLLSNYPNPFNSTTTIEYSLPEAGRVTIEIYDLLGRKVGTPVDEEQEAGAYQVVWDAGDRSSGVYFYRITAGDFAETRRMVLLR